MTRTPPIGRRARGTRTGSILAAFRAICAAIVFAASAGTAGADELSTARALYASAAYEEALAALNRARVAGVAPSDALAVEQYRAFCLLALGRATEAESAIEALVSANPLHRLSASDVSPRVRTAFSEVRQRLLPAIITQQYTEAKAAFDKKDFAAAAAGFARVLKVLGDPDVSHVAAQPPLSDLRTLAAGFQELSVKAAEPPPAPVAPPAPEPPPEPVIPAPPRVYTSADPRVVPPSTVRQDLPNFVGRLAASRMGALEVVIDERGLVEMATIRQTVNPSYDHLALDSTRNWRYQPATVDGIPVKFRKLIQIAIKPTN
jgi:hypothetical protein